MNKYLSAFFTFLNKFFYKRKNKISLWGRCIVNDNIEQILSYLIENNYNEKYKIVCHFKNKEEYIKYQVKNVKIIKNPILSVYHMFTSKYIFHAIGLSLMSFKSTKNQIICDTLHGMSDISKCNKESTNMYINYTDDYIVSTSEFINKIIKEYYYVDTKKIIITGFPRNDLLYSNKKISEILNISLYNKIILYMPTYRKSVINGNDSSSEFPLINEENILEINDFLSIKNVLLIIKPHPLQNDLPIFNTTYSNINVITNKQLNKKDVKLYELIGKTDALITDYSSVYMDYLNLDKPLGFVIDDINEYKKGRGIMVLKEDGKVYINPDNIDFPGSIINNVEELKTFINEVLNNIDNYKIIRKKRNQMCNKYSDNQNTKRLLDFLGIM